MADIQFDLPLPVELGEGKVHYLNSCRSKAWVSATSLPHIEARAWPTSDKVKCEVLVYTRGGPLKDKTIIYEVIDHIGDVLWNKKKSMPLILIQEMVATDKDSLEIRITRRKLISDTGAGKHYQM